MTLDLHGELDVKKSPGPIDPMDGSEAGVFEGDAIATGVRTKVVDILEDRYEYQIIPESEIQKLIEFYDEICDVSTQGKGVELTHGLFLESIYSPSYLPLIKVIYEDAIASREITKARWAAITFKLFGKVMKAVKEYSNEEGIPLFDAFMDLYNDASDGVGDFLMQLKAARESAVVCIENTKGLIKDEKVKMIAEDVLVKYLELEKGLHLPVGFINKLNNKDTKSVVISLDFNSTFNVDESYPSTDLVARIQRHLQSFARDFRRIFPDKELILAINTGRPGMYAWGVAEAAFAPIKEVRSVAVAECGGVVLEEGLNKGVMDVAVENPHEWRQELDYIKDYLLSRIEDAHNVIVEPKLSMLSIKLNEGGDFYLRSADGQPITPEWIEVQLKEYFEKVENDLDEELEKLIEEIKTDIPHLREYAIKAINAFKGNGNGKKNGSISGNGVNNGNGHKKKALAGVEEMMRFVEEQHERRLGEIVFRMMTIAKMYNEGLLKAKYNPTAGYVDIGHAELNKYSTLMGHVCRENSLTPKQVLYVQIGDSTTDIIPEDLTEEGQPNECADEAYLIAVSNCNQKLRDAVLRRGSRGIITENPALLGAEAMFKGLKKIVRECRGKDAEA